MGKADFEPWFDMYDCGMHYPNPARSDRTSPNPVLNYRGDEAVLPVFIHKSFGSRKNKGQFVIRLEELCPVGHPLLSRSRSGCRSAKGNIVLLADPQDCLHRPGHVWMVVVTGMAHFN